MLDAALEGYLGQVAQDQAVVQPPQDHQLDHDRNMPFAVQQLVATQFELLGTGSAA
ncbi:hypothetical protein JMJ56_21150 [Belnapia sp. T18]|uniref:Uncharacterized protein n=1 Tax=Belnapia arida TaxID=2804533 RepID=A0ABS1U787_9PROT|nr:hypothetical protein [Belnapia arida]MBL6080528.1 hypothetical protein [Belnapia arida]